MILKLATFEAAGTLFALDVLHVREINRAADIFPVSLAPAALLGLMNLRGQVVSVIDLAVALGVVAGGKPRVAGAWCLVLKTREELARTPDRESLLPFAPRDPAALLVDRIGDMVEIDSSRLAPRPANSAAFAERFVRGVVPLERDLVMLLDLQEILAAGSGN